MESVHCEDVLDTFASNDVLSDFLNDDFEVQEYATNVIQSAAISQRLAQLVDGISMLDKELQSQIASRHEDLLAQATGIESLEGVLTMMQSRISSLQSAVDRIRSKVGEPFQKISARTIQLGRLQVTCDLLRRIIRIQRLSKRLHSQLQGGIREITKAAQSLSELDYLSQGIDLSGIEVIENDRLFILRAKDDVKAQASKLLDQGIASLNQTHTATALQVYFNLGSLRTPVDDVVMTSRAAVKRSIRMALDTNVISQTSNPTQVPKGPGKAGGIPTPGNSAMFRVGLWNNMETLIDQITSVCNQMVHLHKVLLKKRDPITHTLFIDELTKSEGDFCFVKSFWEYLTMTLDEELSRSSRASNFVKQAFEGEFPKLLRLYNDLWSKVESNKTIIQGQIESSPKTFSASPISRPPTDEDYNAEAALKSTLKTFENAYLQRSLSRLFDPINLVFPSGGRSPPSKEELDAIVKTISSEIGVASVDSELGVTVARNVAKTIQLFAVKSEQLISTQGDASQVIGAPTSAQLRNIDVVNSLFALHNAVLKLVEEQTTLPLAALQIIRSSTEHLSLLMASAVQPLVSSVADSVEAIILTIHNEDFSQESDNSEGNTLCSLYIKELRDFVSRVVRDHFSRFACKDFVMESLHPLGQRSIDLFVRHASLVRPLGEGGKMKLAADFAQMELSVSPLCRRVTDLGSSYRLLRAYRPLLFQSDDAVAESSSIGDVIPYSVALHFLFSRAPPDVRSPHQVMEWSIGRYSKWMDGHRSEKERLNMLRGAIESYVNTVRSRQGTSFAPIYPVMVKLLQAGMERL
uniref:Conserved oligomeric Golgi complex subunit 5 n=1 Tax=Phallusia mammillata TaxID=59560 RepID=A0A6F9DAI0_9ASCI|nr:conserved oligomeric Golgi complex subunit 5 [Phallusia mammillata]